MRRRAAPLLATIGALLAASVLLPAVPALAATGSEEDDGSTISVTIPEAVEQEEGGTSGAVLRWGLNTESGSGAFAGGCNFLSAGIAGDSGGSKVWTEADGLYAAASGNVEIVKATSAGGWERASFATKCLDRTGTAVSVTSLTAHTESQVVISGGTGEVSEDGVDLQWTGSFTAAMYGGMTYWSASDPHLVMDADGDGQVTAMVSGYGTDREDLGRWVRIEPQEVVIAEIRDATLTAKGFAQAPEYLGVTSAVAGQVAQDWDNVDHWGAFPDSFVRFQEKVGQAGYWMTTGGQRDRAKVATTLYVSYDAAAPVEVVPEATPPSTGLVISNPTSQRRLTAQGSIVPASTADAEPAALPVSTAATVVRDDGSSFIPQGAAGLPGFVLPALVGVLSVIVAVLCILSLLGVPLLPWLRPV